jgi:hypothetical protein
MSCKNCQSVRIATLGGNYNNLTCRAHTNENIPISELSMCKVNAMVINFKFCADCGTIQNFLPICERNECATSEGCLNIEDVAHLECVQNSNIVTNSSVIIKGEKMDYLPEAYGSNNLITGSCISLGSGALSNSRVVDSILDFGFDDSVGERLVRKREEKMVADELRREDPYLVAELEKQDREERQKREDDLFKARREREQAKWEREQSLQKAKQEREQAAKQREATLREAAKQREQAAKQREATLREAAKQREQAAKQRESTLREAAKQREQAAKQREDTLREADKQRSSNNYYCHYKSDASGIHVESSGEGSIFIGDETGYYVDGVKQESTTVTRNSDGSVTRKININGGEIKNTTHADGSKSFKMVGGVFNGGVFRI